MTERIHFSKVKFDAKIYPRDKWSTATIERYTDSMAGGDTFPPIVLEDGTDRLLDGVHRWKATERLAERGNGFDGKLPFERHTVPEGIPIKLYAASLSVRHGDSITRADRKTLAREIVEDNPEFNTVTLAKMLAVSDETARSYVGDILAKRREERGAKAFRLSRLGWTQKEIGVVLGVVQGLVNKELSIIQGLGKLINSQLESGIPIDEVAQRHGLPLQLVWAMALEGKSDAERLTEIGVKTQPYDVWQFPRCHDLMGDSHPGRIPGEIVCHVLYFFTKPGDVIIDPMAGSGTTADACLLMGRKCFAYDLDDRHERIDIIPHDIAQDGWPDKIAKANLIFWDPPYFKKMDSSNVKDGYIDGSISKMPRADYLSFFREVLAEAKGKVKKGTKLAFLMSDYDDAKGESIFIWDYANVIDGAGWDLVRHIQAPLSTQQVHPDIVGKFRESRRLARLERYLLIAEAK